MSREDYRAAYDDDADNVRGGPTGERVDLLAALGAAVDRARRASRDPITRPLDYVRCACGGNARDGHVCQEATERLREYVESLVEKAVGKPFTLPAGGSNHSGVITGVSSPSTFAEAFAAAPASCPGCERARSVAVGLQGEVERLTAMLAQVAALAPDLLLAAFSTEPEVAE